MILNGPLPDDIVSAQMLTAGSAMLLDAITDYHVRRSHGLPPRAITPNRIMWSMRTANNQWGGTELESGYARERRIANAKLIEANAERDRQANALRVNRDPCPKCAVRADIGCKHNPSHRRETDAHTQGAICNV